LGTSESLLEKPQNIHVTTLKKQIAKDNAGMRILSILGILIGSVIVVFLMSTLRSEPPKKERIELDPLVEVIVLEHMTANFEVSSQGTVLPRTQTALSAEVAGTITSISPKFVAGGVFDTDEVLMRIDPTNYEVELLQADALVALRQIEYDGTKKLKSQGYRAESEYASAGAALATAKADRVRANRNLERTYIRLPYAGIVRAKETDLGEFVSTGTRLGVVFATDYAEIRLPLTDLDLAFVDLPDSSDGANGPQVTLGAVQKGKYTEWNARIIRTEGVVDDKSRVTYAVARIADPYQLFGDGNPLPVGTFVTATIQGTQAKNVIRVPRHIVRGSDEVMIVDADNKLQFKAVSILRSDASYVYADGGVSPGDRVITTVLESAVNGIAVRTTEASN
jgi:RND family efflux transporter MFP subunit